MKNYRPILNLALPTEQSLIYLLSIDLILNPYLNCFLGAKYLVRPVFLCDAEIMYKAYENYDHVKYLGRGQTIDRNQVEENFKNYALQANMNFHDQHCLALHWTIITHEGIAGKVTLNKSSDDHLEGSMIELSYVTMKNFNGRGLTTQAAKLIIDNIYSIIDFEFIGKKIFATVHPNNIGSRCVLEKIGFKRDKELVNIPKYNQVRDYYFLTITDIEEYQNIHKTLMH